MATASTFITYFVIASYCYYCKASSYPVPLLIWSTKSVDVDDEILAGHTLSYEDVQVKYLDKLKTQSKLICLFVQDKLSIDDFAAHQSKHLKHLREVLHSSPTSIVLPSVSLKLDSDKTESNNRLADYLEKNSFGTILPFSYEDVADFSKRIKLLKADVPTVIIVRLPESKNVEDSLRNLELSDEVIGKISDVLSSRSPDYVGLLTADMPRDDVRSGMADARQLSVSRVRDRRSIQDPINDEDGIPCNQTGVLVAKNNSMMYISNIYLRGKNDNNNDTFINTTNLVLPENEIEVHNTSSSEIMLTFPLKGVFQKDSNITMSLLFNRTKIRWWCVNIRTWGKIQDSDFNVSFDCRKIDVPFDKSFACQVNFTFTGKGEMNKSRLVFQGLQLQPFDVKNRTFANAYDCIPFFTPAIWMGLISVGILVAILYGGMLALLSIKSMDRLDNPKDPAIIIHSDS